MVIGRMAWVALGVVGALAGACAWGADEATVPKELELYPNYETISVYAHFEGDSNHNNATELFYRKAGEKEWRKGHVLDSYEGKRWVGTIFWCAPGTEYEVRVRFVDPDGTAPEELVNKVKTRGVDWPVGKGKTFFVSAEKGNDGAAGSEASPFKTIQHGVEALGPGDTLRVGKGLYCESVTVQSQGRPDAYIHIKADAGAVLDSVDPAYDVVGVKERWTSAGEGLFQTKPPKPTNYVSSDFQRLYGFENLNELKTFTNTKRKLTLKQIGGYWYDRAAQTLYVRYVDGAHPETHRLQLATLDYAFSLKGAKHVILEGFEIRTFCRGIRIFEGASDCIVKGNLIHNTDGGISIRAKNCHNNTVEDNDIGQYSSMAWGEWGLCKGSRYETAGIDMQSGRGTVIRRNRVHGSFNGIVPSDWSRDYRVVWTPAMRDTDIHENELYDIGDDALEPDGTGVNLRFWKNRCHSLFHPLSLAPISVGPCYVIRDVYWNYRGDSGGLKLRCISDMARNAGKCYLYHLTVYTNKPAPAFHVTSQTQWENFAVRNCIFRGVKGGISDSSPAKRELPVTLDGDCIFTSAGYLARFGGNTYPTLEAFRQAGQEKHGIQADPKLRDPESSDQAKADLRLKPDSPCIDTAVAIPNINDDFAGAGPDIGAYEYAPDSK